MLHSDIIPGGGLASNIYKNNAYKISYIRKKRKVNITERRRNGDWMALNGHWNVPAIQSTEWWLKGDWMAPFSFHGMVVFRLVDLCPSTSAVTQDLFSLPEQSIRLCACKLSYFNQTWHKESLGDGDSSLFK